MVFYVSIFVAWTSWQSNFSHRQAIKRTRFCQGGKNGLMEVKVVINIGTTVRAGCAMRVALLCYFFAIAVLITPSLKPLVEPPMAILSVVPATKFTRRCWTTC